MATLEIAAVLGLAMLALVTVLLLSRMRSIAAKLRRSEELYLSVIETQTSLICRYLPDTTLTFVNDAYCTYFGKSRDELVGAKFIDLIPDSEREDALRHISSIIERPRTVSYIHSAKQADGSICWQQWIDHVLVDADGEVRELQGIGHDITALKRTELELKQQRDQVIHLTRVASIGELSGAIAHDLNQPLTALLNNAQAFEMLLDTESPDLDEAREIARDIVAESIRAGEIIRRLHGLLKNGDFAPERVDIAELIGEAITLLHGDLVERDIEIVCDFDADVPAVLGDRIQLLQVILNLLLNASEAVSSTAPRDREIRLSAAAGETDDVVIAVADTGPGFAPEVAEHLFEPFYSTKKDGLGLGLCIARSIVTAHNGHIESWNKGDRGAVLALTLPQAPDEQEVTAPAGNRPDREPRASS